MPRGRTVDDRGTAEERFWSSVLAVENCWEWLGSRDGWGYGAFFADGRYIGAHRYAYQLRRGDIPKGLTLDHLCRNKGCVNPDHLEPVTLRENVLRSENSASVNAKKVVCIHGHSDWLPRPSPPGRVWRYCRTCGNNRQRSRYQDKRISQ